MDIERAVHDFVSKGRDLFHRLRAEGDDVSALALGILRTQLHILTIEAARLQRVKKQRAQRPLRKMKGPENCSHSRLIDGVVDTNGQPTNLVYCLECGAITKEPAPKR